MTAGVYAELTEDKTCIILAVTGDDWELDTAGAALRTLTMALKPSDPKGMLYAPATWATVTQLAHTFSSDTIGRWMPRPRLSAWILDEFNRRHAAITDSQPFAHAATRQQQAIVLEPAAKAVQPANVEEHAACAGQPAIDHQPAANGQEPAKEKQLTPRPYQLQAAAMIASMGKFLLFDEPGTGKTASVILGLRKRSCEIFPMVIIVPSWDVADVWDREIRTWAPDWPQPVMYGGSGRVVPPPGVREIFVTTYATARIDAADMNGPLARLRAKTVIADEAHAVKNPDTKQSRAVKRIASRAQSFAALTGTPVTRDTGDVYPLLEAMEPVSWPSRERFKKRYLLTSDDGYGETVEGLLPAAEKEFFGCLAGQYRRVSKADVLSQLPPKVYSVRRVELPPEWRRAYDTMAADMLAELPDGDELPVMSVLAQLTRLQQLASSACDVEVTEELNTAGDLARHYEVTLRAPSWKADCLLEILAERPGQQVAVFANSKQLIQIAGQACEKAGYRCGYLTGGQARSTRQYDIEAFQDGDLNVILATAGAGGLGITLTAAGTVVMLQRSWQLDLAIQPEDRAHRIGNHHDCVEVIDVISKNTVDERVRELLRVKGNHLGQVIRDPRVVRELLGGLR